MSRIQMFAYDIDTHDTAKINSLLTGQGLNPATMPALDLLKAQAKLQTDLITAQVVPKADATALPIFVAPEFFFKNVNGLPYDRATFFNGCEALKTMSSAFPKVLWVVGTVWWQEPIKNGQALVHNTALVIQAGRILHSWQKERLSGIDGLNQGPETWDRWEPAYAHVLTATQDPLFQAPASPGAGQIPMGIEICLDHLTLKQGANPDGVLRTTYLARNGSAGGGVDAHVLTAAGMSVQPENVVAKAGGYLLRVDGGSAANPRSQCLKVGRAGGSPAAALRQWNPTLTAVNPQYVGADVHNRLAHYPAVDIP